MIDDKIDKLEGLVGFDFQYQQLVDEENAKWDAMLKEFRAYEKSGDSTCPQKQSAALRDWKHLQRVQFQNLQENKRSTLTPDRIQKLNDAGFVFCPRASFRTMTWDVSTAICTRVYYVHCNHLTHTTCSVGPSIRYTHRSESLSCKSFKRTMGI